MALRKLERRNYGGKLLMGIKHQNVHSFKEGLILLCQSTLETRRVTHLHGSAHFTIPLSDFFFDFLDFYVEQKKIIKLGNFSTR